MPAKEFSGFTVRPYGVELPQNLQSYAQGFYKYCGEICVYVATVEALQFFKGPEATIDADSFTERVVLKFALSALSGVKKQGYAISIPAMFDVLNEHGVVAEDCFMKDKERFARYNSGAKLGSVKSLHEINDEVLDKPALLYSGGLPLGKQAHIEFICGAEDWTERFEQIEAVDTPIYSVHTLANVN